MNTPNIPYTTLNRIREHSPCKPGWNVLLKSLNKTQADDEPLTYLYLAGLAEPDVNILSVADVLWCCRAEPKYEQIWRLCAVKFAREVQHLMKDHRALQALDVAEAYANGKASLQELKAAGTAAWAAAWETTGTAAGKATGTAMETAVWTAMETAVWTAAWAAVWTAVWTASMETTGEVVWTSEREAVWTASMEAATAKQLQIFKQMVS